MGSDNFDKLMKEYKSVVRDMEIDENDCMIEKSEIAYKRYRGLIERKRELIGLLSEDRFQDLIAAEQFGVGDLWGIMEHNPNGNYRFIYLHKNNGEIISEKIYDREKFAKSIW